jgi:hypothetical protein
VSERLKSVAELYGRHSGEDIYVIGTGASLRVFPVDFLQGRTTVGLNLAWKSVPVTYGITIHPKLSIPEFIPGEEEHPEIVWVTKRIKMGDLDEAQIRYGEERFYFFRNEGRPNTETGGISNAGRFPEWVRAPHEDFLYLWTSIAQTGANFAANLGARNVIMVGCDNTALGGNYHATAQHTRWLGAAPDTRYQQYYEGLAEVRAALRDRGVNLVSLAPTITLGDPDHDFRRLCRELGVPDAVRPEADISPTTPSGWDRFRERARNSARRRIRAARRRIRPAP